MRVLDLMRDLECRDLLEIAYEAYPPTDSPPRLVVQMAQEALGMPETLELLKILELTPGKSHYPLVYPVARHMQPEDRDWLRVETQSLLGILYFLSQSVEVPEKDRQKGRVTVTKDEAGNPFDWEKVLGDSLQIRSGSSRLTEAAVAVYYRGNWFYNDDSDLESKATLSLSFLRFLRSRPEKVRGSCPYLPFRSANNMVLPQQPNQESREEHLGLPYPLPTFNRFLLGEPLPYLRLDLVLV